MSVTNFFEGRVSETQLATIERYAEQGRSIVREFRKDKGAMLSLAIVLFFVALAVFSPHIAPHEADEQFMDEAGYPLSTKAPSDAHIMGTNYQGNDVFSLWLLASQVSVMVGLTAGFAVMIVGTAVGIVAGYYKGKVDLVLMRIVDVIYGIPATPLILVVALFAGNSVWVILAVFALVLWRTMARVIRSQTLSLSERPFVKSAKASGASDFRIMYFHLLPNLLPLILVQGTFAVSSAIILEAGISFLGVGAELSWGSMLQLAFQTGAIRYAYWWFLPPGLSITLLVLAFFTLSRVAEDIANPEAGGLG